MISVETAKALIFKNITALDPVKTNLSSASAHILANDVFAACDIPAFRQSSMDGYAFKYQDKDQQLLISGEMAAGASRSLLIGNGAAARIFTGAPLPEGADTVVMQEKVRSSDGIVIISDENLKPGANIREKGAEIRKGSIAMKKGGYLSPAAIGFLAGIGIDEVEVYPMPKIAIIVTGKELQAPGKALEFGQVYESNSYSLSAALQNEGIRNIRISEADDELQILKNVLEQALTESDVVLLTGGVSVGDYDFVTEASRLCGVEEIFHKVKQKPGKPLFFGKQGEKLVFGLPGNPSSVLSCYYNYVLPALKLLSNKENSVKAITARLTQSYSKSPGLTHFLKGKYLDGTASPLNAQESFRLSSFAQANCLICLDELQENFRAGDTVNVLLLPD